MKIPNEEKTKWEQLYEHGDYVAIQTESGFDRNVIAGAFSKQGKCTVGVYAAIKSFYNKRESQLAKLLKAK